MTTAYFSALKDALSQEQSDESELVDLNELLPRAMDISLPDDGSALPTEAIENVVAPSSPHTPTEESAVVAMKTFNLDLLREAVLHIICGQKVKLRRGTLKRIMEFLSGDFADLTRKIQLQVFLHYCKVDLNLLWEDIKTGGSPISRDLCYDKELLKYVVRALRPIASSEVVVVTTEQKANILKAVLCKPAVLSAFDVALNDLLRSSMDDGLDGDEGDGTRLDRKEWMKNEISLMDIHEVSWFGPWLSLRGAALIDGILLCKANITGPAQSDLYRADLVTLLCHQCVHYLAMLKFKDFNFSSPWKYLPASVEKRTDLVETTMPLELGRNVELLLCGGIRPKWIDSFPGAATEFLDRLSSKETYPLIEQSEHEQLGLYPREVTTRYFGVELRGPNTAYY